MNIKIFNSLLEIQKAMEKQEIQNTTTFVTQKRMKQKKKECY